MNFLCRKTHKFKDTILFEVGGYLDLALQGLRIPESPTKPIKTHPIPLRSIFPLPSLPELQDHCPLGCHYIQKIRDK
jgi:hypothetical protein